MTVKSTEPGVQIPPRRTGVFATLRGLLGSTGNGGGLLPVIALVTVSAALAFVVGTAPALASEKFTGPPQFEPRTYEEAIFSIRAHIVEQVVYGEPELTWRAEYITAAALKEAEAKKEAPKWVAAGSGTAPAAYKPGIVQSAWLFPGMALAGQAQASTAILRGLAPETQYELRFQAETVDGKAEKTVPFKTTGVAKPEVAGLKAHATSPTSAVANAQIETNGAETAYHIEYAPAEASGEPPATGSAAWKQFASGASGTITTTEEFATPEAKLTGLAPETTYYARIAATNVKGTTIYVQTYHSGLGNVGEQPEKPENETGGGNPYEPYVTPTARPVASVGNVRNVTGTSAHVSQSEVVPHGMETRWRFETATSQSGPWSPVAGASGVISLAEAEALPEGGGVRFENSLSALKPGTTYYLRLFAENATGEEGRNALDEPIVTETRDMATFQTSGAPDVSTFAVHGLHGEALRIMGSVNPNSVLTSGEQTITVEGSPAGGTFTLSFEGETTGPIAFNASASSVGTALEALPALRYFEEDRDRWGSPVTVAGPDGGPYTVYFGEFTTVPTENPLFGKEVPQITADASGLTPSGTGMVTVATVLRGGEGYDASYHFEYVAQKQFEAPGGDGGFAEASDTPDVEVGSGDMNDYVGADLPTLKAGETYRFRLVATNTSPGNPVVDGEEQSLTVPAPSVAGASEAGAGCPNEDLRTGLSALLLDCRAYEQVTPVEKSATQELFNYGGSFGAREVAVGEDGDHVMFAGVTVKYGFEPGAGQSPYVFSRGGTGWSRIGGTPAGAGVFHDTPQIWSADFGSLAFESSYTTSPTNISPLTDYGVGPAGGPYATVAEVPTVAVESAPHGFVGWVAASRDYSKLILQVPDHAVLGHSTHTREGSDLYEYSNGTVRQVNVVGPAPEHTIGSCGAIIAGSTGPFHGFNREALAASHVVSGDGSSVFFEAAPGSDCSEATHLYVRVDGGGADQETIDVGQYRFVAASSDGSVALLEKPSGKGVEDPGLYLYELGGMPKLLKDSQVAAEEANLLVSEDLSTVYVVSGQVQSPDLYRYDVADERLTFITHLTVDSERNYYATSIDGRYFYFIASSVAGLPSGGPELQTPHAEHKGRTSQVFRYDRGEDLVQCMSCASSFDPEPKLSALFAEDGSDVASENGDYVFFDTPAALVPGDVDGQIAPEGLHTQDGGEHTSSNDSLSSDVYEWRKDGIGGCEQIQGCVSLITSGHGGFLNILLGTTMSGNDVFFATKESLVGSDRDSAMDIYDARVDGGFPEPGQPVECAGDACAPPVAAPIDQTPASFAFQGMGNIVQSLSAATRTPPRPRSSASKPRSRVTASVSSRSGASRRG